MRGATDQAIWSFARDHGFTLVSKDDDFRSLALVRGAPPKVAWQQIGNTPTWKVADCFAPTSSCPQMIEHPCHASRLQQGSVKQDGIFQMGDSESACRS
jgi:predicted nuclease of predicted toxin-antitoxin system